MNESKYRVLLVDDEPNLRKVLSALLIQQGFAVHTEHDGEAALARVRSAPADTFDVVISDLRMPNMNGMELLRALSREEPSPSDGGCASRRPSSFILDWRLRLEMPSSRAERVTLVSVWPSASRISASSTRREPAFTASLRSRPRLESGRRM